MMKDLKLHDILKMSEDDIQRSCFIWFRYQYPWYSMRFFHIPNGGQRNIIVASKLKGLGVKAGVWDCFLSVPKQGYSGMFIEIKSHKGKLTENQKEFKHANDLDYLFKVCYSLEDFKTQIDKYLG